jgi:menaquinone-dependent protoporphyrinogen IX oxidase
MKIIIYGSQYGTTKQYGDELSKKTGIKAVKYSDVNDINQYDTIIYLGALYAGSVLGMKKTLKKIEDAKSKKIIIATVGLADPSDENNMDNIREGIKKQLPDDVYSNATVYFLWGGIDYSKLSLKHKTMMAFVHKKSEGLKEEERTAEIKAIIETYGKKVSYVDFDTLNPIINEIQ